jgi:hypothetical protein
MYRKIAFALAIFCQMKLYKRRECFPQGSLSRSAARNGFGINLMRLWFLVRIHYGNQKVSHLNYLNCFNPQSDNYSARSFLSVKTH